jgi:recombination protein RecR
MNDQPDAVGRLVAEFRKLPGIGAKTAQRLAFHLLQGTPEDARLLAQSITDIVDKVNLCTVCCNITEADPCAICTGVTRDRSVVCVVEDPADLASFDRGGTYRGLYHVLHGVLSPLRGVGPEDLTVDKLIERLGTGEVEEVVVATNPTSEGTATAAYLAERIKPMGVKVTRIARGVPVGGDIEYVDEATLTRAIEGRHEI